MKTQGECPALEPGLQRKNGFILPWRIERQSALFLGYYKDSSCYRPFFPVSSLIIRFPSTPKSLVQKLFLCTGKAGAAIKQKKTTKKGFLNKKARLICCSHPTASKECPPNNGGPMTISRPAPFRQLSRHRNFSSNIRASAYCRDQEGPAGQSEPVPAAAI